MGFFETFWREMVGSRWNCWWESFQIFVFEDDELLAQVRYFRDMRLTLWPTGRCDDFYCGPCARWCAAGLAAWSWCRAEWFSRIVFRSCTPPLHIDCPTFFHCACCLATRTLTFRDKKPSHYATPFCPMLRLNHHYFDMLAATLLRTSLWVIS